MPEYEYKVEPWGVYDYDHPRRVSEFIQDGLNNEASRGWRTVGVMGEGAYVYVVLEREKNAHNRGEEEKG